MVTFFQLWRGARRELRAGRPCGLPGTPSHALPPSAPCSAMPGTSGMPGGQPGPQGGSELGPGEKRATLALASGLLAPRWTPLPVTPPPGPYRRVRRQRTDVAWTVGWALLLLLTFVWGVALAARRNPDYARLINDSSFAQSPASCPAGGRRSLAAAKAEVTPDDFFRLAAGLLAASLAVGLAVGWLVIVGYSRDGVRMTRIAIGIKVALPIALGVLFLITGPVGSGVFLLIVGLAIAGLFWCIRERLAYGKGRRSQPNTPTRAPALPDPVPAPSPQWASCSRCRARASAPTGPSCPSPWPSTWPSPPSSSPSSPSSTARPRTVRSSARRASRCSWAAASTPAGPRSTAAPGSPPRPPASTSSSHPSPSSGPS